MTQLEKDIKSDINRLITELLMTDCASKMLMEISNKVDRVDISDDKNLEAQTRFCHLMNLGNIVYDLQGKSIHFTKSALVEYRDKETPQWVDIVNKNL